MKNIYVLTLAMVEAGVHAVFLTCSTIPTLSCHFPLFYHAQCSFSASATILVSARIKQQNLQNMPLFEAVIQGKGRVCMTI
jgi:hypothetical protein